MITCDDEETFGGEADVLGEGDGARCAAGAFLRSTVLGESMGSSSMGMPLATALSTGVTIGVPGDVVGGGGTATGSGGGRCTKTLPAAGGVRSDAK